jgi:pilus assembly protein CpaB
MSSMQRRLVSLALAVIISGATVLFVQQWLHKELANRPAGGVAEAEPLRPLAHVLVAKSDIPVGTFLTAELMRWQEWPRDSVDAAYVLQENAKLEDFIGAVVRSRVTSGEPITAGRVVHSGDRGFMSAVLDPGSRAVTVNVTASTGMAGFVLPGDRVDLLLTMVVQSGNKDAPARHMSETVLTDLRVLAMDQRLTDDKKDVTVPKTATLEVTPKQAELVAVASELGQLSLSLRSLADDGVGAAPGNAIPTWDSEATHLSIKEAIENVQHKIVVVRGSQSSELSLAPTSPGGAQKP